jgi:hypothetical protein
MLLCRLIIGSVVSNCVWGVSAFSQVLWCSRRICTARAVGESRTLIMVSGTCSVALLLARLFFAKILDVQGLALVLLPITYSGLYRYLHFRSLFLSLIARSLELFISSNTY